ncbi:MAG TPA: hypothetical protein VH538_12515 [Gaiellaceae bacterium]|jgi:hypothetical protein
MSGYAVTRVDKIDEIDDGRCPWRPIRAHFGIRSFGVNAFTGRETGDRIINEHDETDDGQEELYVVTTGRATFELDGERRDAPAGTLVYVGPGVKRTAFAEEPGTTLVAVGAVPGQVFEPGGWELWVPLHRIYEAGEYEQAADRGRELLAEHDEYPLLYYNVACCESKAGRKDDAIEHLRQGIEKSDRLRSLAKDDSDFDAIRDEPAFKELIEA